MRIAVIGVGGIGGYYAALLARGGHAVTCVARGANLEAIAGRGIEIRGPGSGESITIPCAAAAPGQVAPAELVIVAVKSYDTAAASAQNAGLLAGATAILPLQNGLDHLEVLDEAAGKEKVLGAVARGSVHRLVPGVLECVVPSRIELGPRFPGQAELARKVWQELARAVEVLLVEDIQAIMWEKLCWNAAFNSLTALLNARVGPILGHPGICSLAEAIIQETIAVATAEGIAMPAGTLDTVMEQARRMDHVKTSMQVDGERGCRLEHEALTGAVVRRGRKHGVPTPVTATIDTLLAFCNDFGRDRT